MGFCVELGPSACFTSSMRVYLLRHAKAVPGFPDADRALSTAGQQQVRRLGHFLRDKEEFTTAHIWHSPLQRTRETMEGLLEAWGGSIESTQMCAALVPEADPEPLLADLAGLDRDVVLIGHNPNLELLASLLLSGERYRTRIHLGTCGLICLDWRPIPNLGQFGPCELRWKLAAPIL